MAEQNPKLFISYGWSNPEHEKWVIDFATELVASGIDVIFDKWDLKEGQDANAFMERMVTDPQIKKVVIICDPEYAKKANRRTGGVGTETQIISPEIYSKADQNKFVAVLTQRDENGMPYLPTYYKSRIYIDLSNSNLYASNFEQLLRWIYDKPLYVKPELGNKPTFLSEENPISLETTTKYRRALAAIQDNKDYASGALDEYFTTFTTNLEKFRITKKDGEFDDQVIENIEKFLPYRNEAIEIFLAISQYRDTPETIQQEHRFLESLIPYMEKPQGVTSWNDWDFDNFKFTIHELFLYAIACLIKYERFNSVGYLLRQHYYVESNAEYGNNSMVPFTIFGQYLKSLDHRNTRLKLNRRSIRADLLIQRSKISGIRELHLMQADFVLFLKDSFESLKHGSRQKWWPGTLIYIEHYEGAFEIFARAQSVEYFNKLKYAFDIQSKEDFKLLLETISSKKLHWLESEFSLFSPEISKLFGFKTMATLS